jgi:hypothetical protein
MLRLALICRFGCVVEATPSDKDELRGFKSLVKPPRCRSVSDSLAGQETLSLGPMCSA